MLKAREMRTLFFSIIVNSSFKLRQKLDLVYSHLPHLHLKIKNHYFNYIQITFYVRYLNVLNGPIVCDRRNPAVEGPIEPVHVRKLPHSRLNRWWNLKVYQQHIDSVVALIGQVYELWSITFENITNNLRQQLLNLEERRIIPGFEFLLWLCTNCFHNALKLVISQADAKDWRFDY